MTHAYEKTRQMTTWRGYEKPIENFNPDDRDTVTCDPTEAEFATLYALTDLGEAIAIHDANLTSAGADEVATIARALFVAIVNARRDPPDVAQRHEAEQAAHIDPDRLA